ncbi:alpha/beta hydrolase family protein [Fredinandcohnia onubensis]|uniref:alpha/beta hydrolase family protein n=1 Tax=Fredinandcohnia onubensis TaxID=1571209 RepID=UPI000C0C089D|nr:prolyl oligopeptidase family serine peptidase [Fredinandcohnia onubensis]
MELIELLGERSHPKQPSGTLLRRIEYPKFILDEYSLELNGLESVPAYFIKPVGVSGPYPTIIFNHSHGGDFIHGKDEVINGASYLQTPSFAETFSELGFAVWAIDAWGFGERGGINESELYKEFLLKGHTLWGMRLFDLVSLIDYLETREDIDSNRLATLGMSMGGLLSWWLSAIDKRIKVTIDIAAQVDIETLIENRRLDHHGFYYYIPKLLKYYSTASIQEKIAPRPRMSLVGKNDTMCFPTGVEKLKNHLIDVYKKQEKQDHFMSLSLTGGHMETTEMRAYWTDFLKKHL